MSLQTEKYETLHLTDEELSVISAFFKINCLYGVSKNWMSTGREDLHTKVIRVVKKIENSGYLLVRADGTVEISNKVYSIFKKMADCSKMVKVVVGEKRITEIQYFYFGDDAVVTLRPDFRGGYFLGEISSVQNLIDCMDKTQQDDSKSECFGVLAMKKYGSLYKTEIDETAKDKNYTKELDLWTKICYFLLGEDS